MTDLEDLSLASCSPSDMRLIEYSAKAGTSRHGLQRLSKYIKLITLSLVKADAALSDLVRTGREAKVVGRMKPTANSLKFGRRSQCRPWPLGTIRRRHYCRSISRASSDTPIRTGDREPCTTYAADRR
jgi:hypothetical protein